MLQLRSELERRSIDGSSLRREALEGLLRESIIAA